MLWKFIRRCLPFVGVALFVYLIIRLDATEIFKQIIGSNKFYLIIAVIFAFFYLIFQTLKWHILARRQKIQVLFKESFKINLMSNFYGLVTPGKLGTAMRAVYLKKYSNIGKGISNFIIDKVLDLVSLFSLAIILGFIVLKEKLNLGVMNYLIILFVILLGVFFIFYNKKRSKFLLKFVYQKLIPKRLKEQAKTAFDSFYEDLPKKGTLIMIFGFNLFSWVICYVATYIIALSLGIDIKFIYFLAIYPVATLVAQIPVTISGLGTREATLIGLFGLFRIGAVKIFSMSLIGLFIMAVFPALIAIPLIFKERKKNEIYKISEGRQESREGFRDS